ncbi:MAG: GAF domain-containing protein [Anaerolineae bacterium]|nr:GAF domain-containing protein [Anaerolineae bacterium]
MDAIALGIVLVTAGALLFLVTRLLVRIIPSSAKSLSFPKPEFPIEGDSLKSNDAVLVIQTGGRVAFANDSLRHMFNLSSSEAANLEKLSRSVRPAEGLLKLCSSEGKAQLLVSGKVVLATSYQITLQPMPMMVVTFHQPEQEQETALENEHIAQRQQAILNLSKELLASTELHSTLCAILGNIEKTIPADDIQLSLWDSATQQLTPYHLIGSSDQEHAVEVSQSSYLQRDGFASYLAQQKQPIWIADIQQQDQIPDNMLLPATTTYRSYLGLPLQTDGDLIAVLELRSLTAGFFQKTDLDFLQLIASTVSIALQNSLSRQLEKDQVSLLSTIARLSQSISAIKDPDNLFSDLVQIIVPLLHVEVLGFITYNNTEHTLEGQLPFHGLPPQFIELYRIAIQNNAAEQVILDQKTIITENAAEDHTWELLGLNSLAMAASLRETILQPITSGGHMLGYLQASNHSGGYRTFDSQELELISIIAKLVAPLIENNYLARQNKLRAMRSETLRRIANLASSSMPLNDITRISLQEIAKLYKTNACFLLLINHALGELQFHTQSLVSPLPVSYTSASLRLDDAQYLFSVSGRQIALICGNLSQEKALIPFYQKLFSEIQAESAICAPLTTKDLSIGEIWITNQQRNYFQQADLLFLTTVASLLTGVIEQNRLSAETDKVLRTRVDQLTSMSRLNRELCTTWDVPTLLQMIYDAALRLLRATCGTILLFKSFSQEDSFSIRAYAGDPPPISISPKELKVLETGSPQVISGTNLSSTSQSHQDITSILIAPIIHLERPVGLLILHAKEPDSFDKDAVETCQMLANQVAPTLYDALELERILAEEQLLISKLEIIKHLFQDTPAVLQPNHSLQEILSNLCAKIKLATGFASVWIGLFDPVTQLVRKAAGDLVTLQQVELNESSVSWSVLQGLMRKSSIVGKAYRVSSGDNNSAVWKPEDVFLLPIAGSSGAPLALILLSQYQKEHIPQSQAIESLELFLPQIGFVIESHRHFNTLVTNLAEMEEESNRLKQALSHTQKQLPVLLRKDLEQTATIQKLLRHLDRARNGIEIALLSGQQRDMHAFIKSLATEMLTRFQMNCVLIANITPAGLKLVETLGDIPNNTNPEAFLGQYTPFQAILKDRRPILVENLDNSSFWRSNALLNALRAKSFICLLTTVSETEHICFMLIGKKPVAAFSEDDQQMFFQLARQASISLQNQRLLNETRQRLQEVDLLLEFSRKIGSLNPVAIFEALLETASKVIPGAQAGWVGMWDASEQRLSPKASFGYNDAESLMKINFAEPSVTGAASILAWRVYLSGNICRIDELDFPRDYNLSAEHLELYRKATAGRLPVSSLLIPLKRGENKFGLLVLNNFQHPAAFSEQDERLALSLTQQAALALESAQLYQAAENRSAQLQALTHASGAIASRIESKELISSLLDELHTIVAYDTATLWLREDERLIIADAKGFPDNESRIGIFTTVEDSVLFQEISLTGETLSIEDVRHDARFPSLLEPDCLSWLGIPLISKSRLNGLIALEKKEAGFYTPELIQITKTFASQAAIALENALLFEESKIRAIELDLRSQRLTILNQLSHDLGTSLDIDHILQVTSERLLNALGGDRVSSIIIGNKGHYILRTETPPTEDFLPQNLHKTALLQRLSETQGVFSSSDVLEDPDLFSLQNFFQIREARSVLSIPLVTGMRLYGWLWLLNTTPYRYSATEIEMARTIANQAALAVQNAISFEETRRLTEDLERRVEERTADLKKEHENTQTLLRIISELSASLELDEVLKNAMAILNESLGAEQSLILMADGTSAYYQVGIPLIIPSEQPILEMPPEQEISGWIIKHRESVLIDNIVTDPRWKFPHPEKIPYHSVLGFPLILGEHILGTLLLLHRESYYFQQDQIDLAEAVARQISITINNATLYDITSDQSERLIGMLRDQEIEASRSLAILEAVADGVLVTDANKTITLFNASAEKILGLKASEVTGHPLDRFLGLFGNSALSWIKTIQRWSEEPLSHHPGETYSERITLDNGHIVLVHLSPVILGVNFLGTVSIFRDITHEVQVDRLKSEFVANVSHELRTPMTSVKGYVDLLLMKAAGELNSAQEDFLSIVKNNINRLEVLVDDLLDISRLESGHITLFMTAIDIKALCEESVLEFTKRSEQENKPMTYKIMIEDDLPRAFGDQARIRQVVNSLLSNSYNYTPPGGKIQIHGKMVNDQIQIAIQDNGIGIAPEDHPRIFERFYRGEDPLVLASAGTGLGLAISKIIIEMHQGSIWFESDGIPGKGSTFFFTLPIYQQEK